MKIRSRRGLKRQKLATTFIVLLPLVVIGSLAGIAGSLFSVIPAFGMDPSLLPDMATLRLANYTRLAQMASRYDQRFEDFHVPFNYTVGINFTDTTLVTPRNIMFNDNGALWTGTAIVAFVGKYLAGIREDNATMKDDALRVIRRLVHGMSMMLAVPNGGLGPDYGALVGRFWLPPENRSTPDLQQYSNSQSYKFYNGSGPYKDWLYSDFTSNDEYGGFYMGIALAFKYVTEDPYVQATTRLVIDQLCTGMLHTNFLGIGGFGGPTGVDQKMRLFQGGAWILLVLKLGALAFPEKYEPLYLHYAVEKQYAFHTEEGGAQEIVSNYFAFNFGIDVVFALMILEEDPVLSAAYLKNFDDSMWEYVQYHRNAYFNAIYLIIHGLARGDDLQYERDVEDQLMEFDINHFPDVNVPVHPDLTGYETVDFSPWVALFNNHAFFNTLYFGYMEFGFNLVFYDKPLTVSMRNSSIFIWGGNPFRLSPRNAQPTNEEPGISFMAPYWLMRGFGFVLPGGMREP
jgi:hypothetical protein